jgi:gluconolactonase
MKAVVSVFLLAASACVAQKNYTPIGTIERYDSAVNAILSPAATAEVIASGFNWTEGPLWLEKEKMLLFSDIPGNIVYRWTEASGTSVYLTPSGYTGTVKRGGETGSNGLLLDGKGRLVLCQHGDRRVARMNAALSHPAPQFITLASRYSGKRFNSPNDAIFNSRGELFFTDPPYGLEHGVADTAKELSFQGVYKVKTGSEVVLLTDTISRPNGIALLPDGRTLLIGNSDSYKPHWYAITLDEKAGSTNGRIFYSAEGYDKTWTGNIDGLKVDKNGNVFATGPGGLWIFNSDGKLLGKLRLADAASNCALSADEKTLYITNDKQVLRFRMR